MAAFGAVAAQARDCLIIAGATSTSRYVFSGQDYPKGTGFQPYLEFESGGFYGGLWASNVGGAENPKSEFNVYAGYRNQIGNFSYDVG